MAVPKEFQTNIQVGKHQAERPRYAELPAMPVLPSPFRKGNEDGGGRLLPLPDPWRVLCQETKDKTSPTSFSTQ